MRGEQLEKTPSIIIYDSIDNLSGVYTEPIKHLRQLASFFLELVGLENHDQYRDATSGRTPKKKEKSE